MDRRTAAQLLGVPTDASARQVESAFRRRIKVAHPDRFPPGSEAAEDATVVVRQLVTARDVLVGEQAHETVGHREDGAPYVSRETVASPVDRFRTPADTDRLARAWGLSWGSFLIAAAVVSYVVGAHATTNDALPLWSPALALIGLMSLAIGWRAHRRLTRR